MPLIYHEGYSLGDGAGDNQLLKDTVGWTGKNLIPLPYEFGNQQTQGGITAKTNADGSITFNGTVTASISFRLKGRSIHDDNYFLVKPGKYIFSCGNIENDFYWGIATTKNNSYSAIADGLHTSIYELTITSDMSDEAVDGAIPLALYANFRTLGDVYNNFTIYPMLRKADITDPTYEPYHESVEEEIEQIYAGNGVLGAKNLLPNNATSQTVNGVTFTVNDDKSVTVNGTATANADFPIKAISNAFAPPAGEYVISRGGSQTSNVQLYANLCNGTRLVRQITNLLNVEKFRFTLDYNGYDRISIGIYVSSGKTINNFVIKPMLRLASDPDDTYQPYAMTNRELTESVASKALSFTPSTANATLLRNDSKIKGDIVSVRVQLQVTSEIASGTELIRNNGTPHVGFGVAVLGDTNTGNMYETYIASSPSNLAFVAKNTIPTGYYALNYTYIQ